MPNVNDKHQVTFLRQQKYQLKRLRLTLTTNANVNRQTSMSNENVKRQTSTSLSEEEEVEVVDEKRNSVENLFFDESRPADTSSNIPLCADFLDASSFTF